MEKNQTITIKLKPYLQEYLTSKLEEAEISYNNIIGVLLAPFIEYIPKDYKYIKLEGFEYISLPVRGGIGSRKFNIRAGLYVSEKNQKEFEKALETHFNDVFYNYIDDKYRYKREIKKCIVQFCVDYNIGYNVVTYEMLKKRYYRRMIINKQKSCNKMSLRSPLLFLM